MCDQISWAFMGLSMPTWNAIFSIILVLIWTLALRQDKSKTLPTSD
jgi:disulfide bond formation protein DsbB